MNVATLSVRLNVRHARTLKDKRQVLQSIIQKIRAAFNVSVAEIDRRDEYQVIVLGLAAVAEHSEHARQTLEEVVNALRAHPVAEFVSADWDSLY